MYFNMKFLRSYVFIFLITISSSLPLQAYPFFMYVCSCLNMRNMDMDVYDPHPYPSNSSIRNGSSIISIIEAPHTNSTKNAHALQKKRKILMMQSHNHTKIYATGAYYNNDEESETGY